MPQPKMAKQSRMATEVKTVERPKMEKESKLEGGRYLFELAASLLCLLHRCCVLSCARKHRRPGARRTTSAPDSAS
eukprot:224305-Rhodomonas_salina.2